MPKYFLLLLIPLLTFNLNLSASNSISFDEVAPPDAIIISKDVVLDDDSIITFYYPSKTYSDVSFFPIRVELTSAEDNTEIFSIRDFVAGPSNGDYSFEDSPLKLNDVSDILDFYYDRGTTTRIAYSPIVYTRINGNTTMTNILSETFRTTIVPREHLQIISPNEIYTNSSNPITINNLKSHVSIVNENNTPSPGNLIILNDTYSDNMFQPGTYYITWAIEDYEYTETTTTIVHVTHNDVSTPYISLNGNNTIYVEVGNNYTELGASAFIGDTSIPVTITGIVDTSKLGSYEITYQGIDVDNQTDIITRNVIVRDTTPPIIMITGEETITLEYGDHFEEPGVIAKDNFDSNIEVIMHGSIDHNTLGTYELTYTAKDSSNNHAVPITRTITIVDTKSPILQTQDVYFTNIETFTTEDVLKQLSALDNYDGEITDQIRFIDNSSAGNEHIPGSYIAFVSVEDSSGNKVYSLFNIIVEDKTKPEFIAPKNIFKSTAYITQSNFYMNYVKAHDQFDGELTESITIKENNYLGNANTKGEYLVVLSVKDNSDNETLHELTIHVIDMIPLLVIEDEHIILSHEMPIDDLSLIETLKKTKLIPNDTYILDSVINTYLDNEHLPGTYQHEFILNSHSGNDYALDLVFEVTDLNTNIINQTPSIYMQGFNLLKTWWWIPTILVIMVIGIKKQ